MTSTVAISPTFALVSYSGTVDVFRL
jgi:hypothetical protein